MIDHCGPMAGSVRDAALFLSVIAGWDGLDPRMTPETPLRQNVPQYHELLDEAIEARRAAGHWTPTTGARGLRIGLIKEAWDAPQLNPEVASAVREAGRRFASLGGTVEEVSVPLHAVGGTIFTAATRSEMAEVFVYGRPPDCLGWPLTALANAPEPGGAWYETMNRSAPTVVDKVLSGEFLRRGRDKFPPSARGKAMTHVYELRAAYDTALEEFDVLVTPANPTVGMRHPSPDLGVVEKAELALGNTWNTCPFNITGHPGLVMPVGWGRTDDGSRLPIGMQMVGKRWGEGDLFLAAAAWELGGLGLDG